MASFFPDDSMNVGDDLALKGTKETTKRDVMDRLNELLLARGADS